MSKSSMALFVTGNKLVLKAPTDDQVEAILGWMAGTAYLGCVTSHEGSAIFTPSGRGKASSCIALEFKSTIADPQAEAVMQQKYPAPKSLAGLKLTSEEAPDKPLTKEEKLEAINQENAIGGEPILDMEDYDPDQTQCYSVAELQAAKA